MTTDIAALVTWVITAGFGLSLFGTWLARGGLTQHPRGRWMTVNLPPPYFPAPLVFRFTLIATSACDGLGGQPHHHSGRRRQDEQDGQSAEDSALVSVEALGCPTPDLGGWSQDVQPLWSTH
jgi:hypothetical protein